MANYPIIEQKSLRKASRRGPLRLASPRRGDSELPLPNAHEVVVYKTAGTYFVDDGRSRPGDDHVVNATNISVVDMREDAPVTVQATIPSAGAAEFVVQVTFLCTVKKPEEVVEAGLQDVTTSLTNYLMRHQPLFRLGEDYHLDQVTAVRHNVASDVKAYFSGRPARLRGLEVKLGSIQVMTPDELRSKQRERELEAQLTSEQQEMEHRLAQQKAEFEEERRRSDEEFELVRRRHEQDLAQWQQKLTRLEGEFQHQLQKQQLSHDQLIRTKSFEHAADEAARLKGALGADDSQLATVFAGALGERSISETADSLIADRDRQQEQQDEEKRRRAEWEHEDKQYQRQLARETARMKYELEVDRLKTQAEVVVAAVNRGLADHQNIEFIMSELRSVARQLERASAGAPRHETEQSEGLAPPKRQAPPERSDGQADDGVVEAEIVSDDFGARGDEAESGPREEDLGR
jgi:hypothetical protein